MLDVASCDALQFLVQIRDGVVASCDALAASFDGRLLRLDRLAQLMHLLGRLAQRLQLRLLLHILALFLEKLVSRCADTAVHLTLFEEETVRL